MESMQSYKAVYVGLNVEKGDIISVVLPDEGGFCLSSDAVSADTHKLSRYMERLVKRFGREHLHVCYEAFETEDFSLLRTLTGWGISCRVVQPLERPADKRRKTGRRDAERLARAYRDGRAIVVPAPHERLLRPAASAAPYRAEALRTQVASPRRQSSAAAAARRAS